MTPDLYPVHAGFLPLLDAAILVAGREKSFAGNEGIDLKLIKETSWANIRDRMAVGHFEAAHMLAPMPIAAALGLTPMPVEIIAPMALGLGGNAVTVSTRIYDDMRANGYPLTFDARMAGSAIGELVRRKRTAGQPRLVFAVVHPFSAHNYDLRYWLKACGVDPETEIEIVFVPPPLMPDALRSGKIDGYCVGEPWNSVAVAQGQGAVLTTKAEIWRSSPEKVLGVSREFSEARPEILKALLRALTRAAEWCGRKENHDELVSLLSLPHYVGMPDETLRPALKGLMKSPDQAHQPAEDFFILFSRAANFPWKSHALWFYSQMVRWGHAPWDPSRTDLVASTYRPDIYRSALASLDFPVPAASSKVEGALTETVPVGASIGKLDLGPDGFFDGKIFDPHEIGTYVKSQTGA